MARKRKRRLKIGRVIIALAIVVVIVLAVIFAVKALSPDEGNPSSSTPSQSSTNSESNSSSQQVVTDDAYGAVQMSKDDIHQGDLILVNYDAHYVTDAPTDLVTVASQKQRASGAGKDYGAF